MNTNQQYFLFLLEPDELRGMSSEWPANVSAVVAVDSRDSDSDVALTIHVARMEEFPARYDEIAEDDGVDPSEVTIVPQTDGYATTNLRFNQEQAIVRKVEHEISAGDLVEDAQSYNVNYQYALDEGLDPRATMRGDLPAEEEEDFNDSGNDTEHDDPLETDTGEPSADQIRGDGPIDSDFDAGIQDPEAGDDRKSDSDDFAEPEAEGAWRSEWDDEDDDQTAGDSSPDDEAGTDLEPEGSAGSEPEGKQDPQSEVSKEPVTHMGLAPDAVGRTAAVFHPLIIADMLVVDLKRNGGERHVCESPVLTEAGGLEIQDLCHDAAEIVVPKGTVDSEIFRRFELCEHATLIIEGNRARITPLAPVEKPVALTPAIIAPETAEPKASVSARIGRVALGSVMQIAVAALVAGFVASYFGASPRPQPAEAAGVPEDALGETYLDDLRTKILKDASTQAGE